MEICHFNKHGHCRYGDICRYFHNNKICEIGFRKRRGNSSTKERSYGSPSIGTEHVYEQKERDKRLEELEAVIEKLTDPLDPQTLACVRMPVTETKILEIVMVKLSGV